MTQKELIKQRLQEKRKRRGEIILPPAKPSRRDEVAYRKALTEQVKLVTQLIRETIFPLLKANESAYRKDASFSAMVSEAMSNVLFIFNQKAVTAQAIAGKFVGKVNQSSENNISRALEAKFDAPDLARIIQTEGLQQTLEAKIAENANLIKTIPEDYLNKVEQAIFRNMTAGASEFGLQREIFIIQRKTLARAKFIARDQTAKTNAAITQARQEALGVEEYVWVTSMDERVRDSHKRKNGKRFRWDDPPKDTGHPGTDYNCRCNSRAVVKFD